MLVPLVGIVSAPVLANALGPAGRGTVAAGIAPNVLIAAVATLGLPEALTFTLARTPERLKRALLWATAMTTPLGVLCFLGTLVLLPVLSVGDRTLGQVIVIGTALTIPQLWINLFRGAAAGTQRWKLVAAERVVLSALRLGALVALYLSGRLTVFSAVLTLVLCPLAAGLVYLGLLRRQSGDGRGAEEGRVLGALLDYGPKVWVGSVAGIVLAKLGTVIFAPLSSVEQLGLYVVGITISDVPLIMTVALRDALFGVNARDRDAMSFARVVRIGVAVALVGVVLIAVTVPFWIVPVFGRDFAAAVPVTWLLLLCSLANVPSFLLAAGLNAWGRPGLRSFVIAMTVVVDVALFIGLVPTYGAMGAALANLVSSTAGTVATVLFARRVLGTRVRDLIVLRRSDVGYIVRLVKERTGRHRTSGSDVT